jgi:hypothetical protein
MGTVQTDWIAATRLTSSDNDIKMAVQRTYSWRMIVTYNLSDEEAMFVRTVRDLVNREVKPSVREVEIAGRLVARGGI